MAWRMPAETCRQERIWMAFPRAGVTFDDAASLADGYRAWTDVAHAVLAFTPVTMIVDPSEEQRARAMLSAEIDLVVAPLDDFWMRDIGPTFVVDDETGELGAVDWIFNGWGSPTPEDWSNDREIARLIASLTGTRLVSSLLVNEGGAIHVDGDGTILLTDTVQLDPLRNPRADKARVEAELARTLGVRKAIWLPHGLTRDYEPLGTKGHIDMIATMPAPGSVLLHAQTNPEHPDHAVSEELRAVLAAATDAQGRSLTVIDLPAPRTLRDEHGFVDWSYINHLVTNDGVVLCGYDDPVSDAHAAEIIADAYPGREVVLVDARPILAGGGGIHCITQQQPVAPVKSGS